MGVSTGGCNLALVTQFTSEHGIFSSYFPMRLSRKIIPEFPVADGFYLALTCKSVRIFRYILLLSFLVFQIESINCMTHSVDDVHTTKTELNKTSSEHSHPLKTNVSSEPCGVCSSHTHSASLDFFVISAVKLSIESGILLSDQNLASSHFPQALFEPPRISA
jgi:hypothetical protein